jgi:c(7)-type cytochrome triheme protein
MNFRIKTILLAIIIQLGFMSAAHKVMSQDYGGGPIVFIKPVRAVIFEHKFHLGQDFTCESCHPDLFPKKVGVIEESEDFTMASFNQGKYCGKCHDGTIAFSVNTKCNWCHIGVQGHKHLEEYELGLEK